MDIHQKNKKSMKTKFFNAFILTGLLMNVAVAFLLIIYYFLYYGK